MQIRKASRADLNDILFVERTAFGTEGEANLVRELLGDPSAQPALSLLAFKERRPAGHILFTRLRIPADIPLSAAILAPLAVVPEFQKQGIGGELIEQGCRQLAGSGVELVFVLGYPAYYSRFGFQPAGSVLRPRFPLRHGARKGSNLDY